MMRLLIRVLIILACGGASRLAVASEQPQNGAASSSDPLAGMQVAVTVDDLPCEGELPPGRTRMNVVRALLAALGDQNVPAWGFANGYQVESEPATIQVLHEWLLAGYPLGNHSYHHADLTASPASEYIEDIDAMDHLLQTLSPVSALIERRRVFRYPYLREGDTVAKRDTVRAYLAAREYRVAQVTVDYFDWAWNAASARCRTAGDAAAAARLTMGVVEAAEQSLEVARSSARQVFGRDIPHVLLIHATAFTAETLPSILSLLRSRGVTFVPLEAALEDAAYQTNPNVANAAGLTFLAQVEVARGITRIPEEYSISRIGAICRESSTAR